MWVAGCGESVIVKDDAHDSENRSDYDWFFRNLVFGIPRAIELFTGAETSIFVLKHRVLAEVWNTSSS